MLTAWPIGETLPGPCQAVGTLKNSQQAATLRAMFRPPTAEMWIRMKSMSRSATRKTHSLRFTKS
jgi:hypothetical protein